MGMKSPCGNAVPVLNPPNFGPGIRQQTCSCASQPNVSYPTDPSDLFPRVITDSSVAWQGTSLGTEPGAASGWDPRFPRALCMRDRVLASYEDAGLNYAASQISDLISKVMYPIPGIWLGPVYVHSPSGNVVLHLSVPRGGPYDPIPVFTYNSQAAKANAGRGYPNCDAEIHCRFHSKPGQIGLRVPAISLRPSIFARSEKSLRPH